MSKSAKLFTCWSLLLILALLLPSATFAQGAPTLAAVEVALWPEFDRPGVLVIYRITLSSDVRLPAELTMRIPAAAGKPNAVAVKQPDGSLLNLPYDQQDVGNGWSALTFSATAPDLQIEYYDPGLVKTGFVRHFEYRWPGDYAVGDMSVEVQQPASATSMKISPSMGAGVRAADGLVYFTQQVGSMAQEQTFAITLDYEKLNDDLSAGNLNVYPGGPLDETASGRLPETNLLALVLGLVGVGLIAGGAIWYWRAGRATGENKTIHTQSRPRPRGPSKKDEAEAQDGDNVYCHQCGKRAAAGDRFCRACGTTLRLN